TCASASSTARAGTCTCWTTRCGCSSTRRRRGAARCVSKGSGRCRRSASRPELAGAHEQYATRPVSPSDSYWSRRDARGSYSTMSSRTCPDWPMLMELAPDLQFKHYTVAEARLPADALANIPELSLDQVAICCDLEHNVFYAAHTDPSVAEALRASHWY